MLQEVLQRQLGVTNADFQVLTLLRLLGCENSLTPTDLQAYLALSSGGTTSILNRLQDQGLISRYKNESDGRRSYLQLTHAGLEQAAKLLRTWEQVQRKFFRDLPVQAAQLASENLREVLLAAGDTPPSSPSF